ncbi:MAG: hypothetical protein RI554_09425, partial [Trueperaceae bacterium]|nr:hypothetical protein [Trueperaceae bacterium]
EDVTYDATLESAGGEGNADAFVNASFDLHGVRANLTSTYTATWREDQATQSTWSARLHAHQHVTALPTALTNPFTNALPGGAVVGSVVTFDRTTGSVEEGTLVGERTVTSLSVGSVVVTPLLQDLTLDAYGAIGVVRTRLDVANDDVRITTHPTRPHLHAGVGVSGRTTYGPLTFTPRLGVAYARAAGGTTPLTLAAFGTTERANLSTTAVEVLEASFDPRVELDVVPLLPQAWLEERNVDLSLTPTLTCSVPLRAEDALACGYGLQTTLETPLTPRTTLDAGVTYERRTVHDLGVRLGLERTY